MNAQKLYTESNGQFKPADIWYCEKCRIVYRSHTAATDCCQPRLCACGQPAAEHRTACKACCEANDIRREAEKMAAAEKLETWDGPVYWEGHGYNDGYFTDMGDLLDVIDAEDFDGDRPEFVYVCDTNSLSLNASDLLENELQDWPEDFSDRFGGQDELQKAMDAFCEKNAGVVYWTPNEKKAVKVPAKENQ